MNGRLGTALGLVLGRPRENGKRVLPRIALDRINVRLAGRHVLHDVTWSLNPGEHWAFVGANGSGKSTLLRAIAGTQWIDGASDGRTYSPDGARRDVVARATSWIRLVSAEQHEHYARLELALTGRAVIASGFANSTYVHNAPTLGQTRRIDALLEQFDLSALAACALRNLSSGQIRRLLIARALVSEPRVIVLDECTNGLDRTARRDVLAFLDRIAPQVALVVASHRVDDFPAAITHTATVRDGRITTAVAGRPTRERQARPALRPSAERRESAPVLLSFRHADVYRGSNRVLTDVNWQLRRGEHTLIRGANGAGKTTFAGLIAGTICAATGAQIVRFGKTGPFDIWKLKERIAHLSDDLQIAYDQAETVRAVVASGFTSSIGLFVEPTPAQQRAVDEILRRIGLESLGERTFTHLSFGERRKVLIARSLVRQPAIFVLDEIWNGLDAAFRRALAGLLAEMAATGTTIVAIAHEEDDEISVLGHRICIVAEGTVRDDLPAGA